jgi:hypothetical protein
VKLKTVASALGSLPQLLLLLMPLLRYAVRAAQQLLLCSCSEHQQLPLRAGLQLLLLLLHLARLLLLFLQALQSPVPLRCDSIAAGGSDYCRHSLPARIMLLCPESAEQKGCRG